MCWSRSGPRRSRLQPRHGKRRARSSKPRPHLAEQKETDSLGKADFHMHTSLNDGTATVREVLDYVRDKTDLDVVAITDHDRLTGSYQALDMANEYRFEVVPGSEV